MCFTKEKLCITWTADAFLGSKDSKCKYKNTIGLFYFFLNVFHSYDLILIRIKSVFTKLQICVMKHGKMINKIGYIMVEKESKQTKVIVVDVKNFTANCLVYNNMYRTSLQDIWLYEQAVKITPISAKYIPVLPSFVKGPLISLISMIFEILLRNFPAPGPHLLVPSYGWGRYKEKIVAEQAT